MLFYTLLQLFCFASRGVSLQTHRVWRDTKQKIIEIVCKYSIQIDPAYITSISAMAHIVDVQSLPAVPLVAPTGGVFAPGAPNHTVSQSTVPSAPKPNRRRAPMRRAPGGLRPKNLFPDETTGLKRRVDDGRTLFTFTIELAPGRDTPSTPDETHICTLTADGLQSLSIAYPASPDRSAASIHLGLTGLPGISDAYPASLPASP